jgi:hypothetical protein
MRVPDPVGRRVGGDAGGKRLVPDFPLSSYARSNVRVLR